MGEPVEFQLRRLVNRSQDTGTAIYLDRDLVIEVIEKLREKDTMIGRLALELASLREQKGLKDG